MSNPTTRTGAALTGILLMTLGACSADTDSTRCRLPPDGTVLAIGDSITRGYGADGQGYAEQLQTLLEASPGRTGVRVLNRGIDGERTSGLLARIDAMLVESRPSVVLVTIGGNDFLRKTDERETRANLESIVNRIRAAGAHPVVFAVPRPSLAAAAGLGSDHPLYAQLAESTGTGLIEDVVGDVLAEEALRSDTIHPNALGYARMAEAAFEALSECG
jgi:acyl-CoA thioesterase I